MKNALEILRSTLKGRDPLVAAEAARLIGEWGVQALVPDLLEHARVHRFYSKVTSFYALAQLSAQEAIPLLTELVAEPNVSNDWYWYGAKGVRAAAAVSLLKLGSGAGVSYLRAAAEKRESVFIRWFAPELLRLKPVPELQPYLTVDYLCDAGMQKTYGGPEYSEPGMLCILCEALGLIEDPAAGERLDFYLGHYSRFVRGQAYRSLYRRRPDGATTEKIAGNARKHGTDFDLLVAAEVQKDSAKLADIARNAPDFFDRASAIDALAAISSPALVEAARQRLEDPELYVRQCSVEALARDQGPAAQKYFAGMEERENEIRVLCALAATSLAAKGLL